MSSSPKGENVLIGTGCLPDLLKPVVARRRSEICIVQVDTSEGDCDQDQI